MQEENREHLTEPGEVVRWYVRPEEGQEVTSCYVQSGPMPRRAVRPGAVKKPKRKGLWIFLAAMAVLLGVVIGVAVVYSLRENGTADTDGGQDASSIVDISQGDVPTIPRTEAEEGLRFLCRRDTGEPLTAQEVYAAVNPATVLVVADLGEKASVGSGVLLTEDGYLVTNAHVIAGGKSAFIALSDSRTYEAELVGFDSSEDLALLKAVGAEGLPTAELADSDACVVGDVVYAIGNPLGVELRGTLTNGIISAINRKVTLEGNVMTLLQTTAALNNGNSGGPLINEYGQVIGINTLKMSSTTYSRASVEGLGFAVPANQVAAVLNDIAATGAYHGLPSIGVTVVDAEQGDGTVRPVIYSIVEGYGAEEAGLMPGDVLLQADGVELYGSSDLLAVRRTHIAEEAMLLTVQRNGLVFDVEVYLYPIVE